MIYECGKYRVTIFGLFFLNRKKTLKKAKKNLKKNNFDRLVKSIIFKPSFLNSSNNSPFYEKLSK